MDKLKNKEEQEIEVVVSHVEKLLNRLEEIKINEYLDYLNNKKRLVIVNFVAGLFRGIGYAFGAVVVFAFFYIF